MEDVMSNDNRRILRISHSGHYTDIYCYVTQEMLDEVIQIEREVFLYETDRGREIIKHCTENQINSPFAYTAIGYC